MRLVAVLVVAIRQTKVVKQVVQEEVTQAD
jgi:hypothetical protein